MPENKDDIDLEGWDLHRVAKENRVDIARALIARGDDVNARDEEWTPLHWAALNNSLGMARLLLDRGAEVDARTENGWTPLQRAAGTFPKSRAVASLLIEKGANTDGIDLSWMGEQEDA